MSEQKFYLSSRDYHVLLSHDLYHVTQQTRDLLVSRDFITNKHTLTCRG